MPIGTAHEIRMNIVRRALLRLRAALRHHSLENEMQAELQEHLERATERFVAGGLSAKEARLAARREFGNVAAIQEDARDARGARWIAELAANLHFAVRYFGRHKATVAIIVAVLSLATGANTLIFSLFQSQFLRPAPAVSGDAAQARIWALERATKTAQWQAREFTRPELRALAARSDVFSAVAGWLLEDVVLDGKDSTGARGVGAQFVTPNYFTALGVRLAAGRAFGSTDDDSPDMAAVMSYEMAVQLYGNASAAPGHRIAVNEMAVDIVGVAPPRFQGAVHNMNHPVLWLPLSARADIARISPRWLDQNASLSLFARVAPGVSRDKATAFARQVVANALPDSATRVGMARTADVLGMNARSPLDMSNDTVLGFVFILTIGVLILLVGWMNVSSLMVAAAVGRRHEIAVRLSLGASRARLLRQLVTESTMLALAGATIGSMLAWWTLTWMMSRDVTGYDIAPDVGTFAFVFVLAIASGVLFGLSPALHATRGGVASALRDSGAGTSSRSRLQRVFVAAQIALSQPLLVLLGTLLALVVADYRPLPHEMSHRVIRVDLHPLTGTGAPSQRPDAVDSLIPRIAERPEVLNAVADASGFDVRGVFAPDREMREAGSDTVPTIVHLEGAAPGWLALVDVPIILGRDVSLADTATLDQNVVIGSDLARALWGGASPIGRRLPSPALHGLKQDSITMTVVGVYDASRALPGMTFGGQSATGSTESRVYTAHGKRWRHDRVLVRTRGPAAPFVTTLRQFVRAKAPSLPVTTMMTLAQVDDESYRDTLQMSMLAGAGGALALLLASLGLYGVVSLAVQQRTREIGIRIAVGAQPTRVARMFLASGVRVSLVALVIGLPLSIAGLRIGMARGFVIAPNVNPYLIGAVIGAVLVSVAAAATWVPARRAARVDPARTLRVE